MRCFRCRGIGQNARTCPRIRREAVNYIGEGRSAIQSQVKLKYVLISIFLLLIHGGLLKSMSPPPLLSLKLTIFIVIGTR